MVAMIAAGICNLIQLVNYFKDDSIDQNLFYFLLSIPHYPNMLWMLITGFDTYGKIIP